MNASERRAAYLDDLGRLLQPLSAVERIGVIDGVRERVDRAVARLGHEPTDQEMAGILAGIGAIEDVADDALAASASATPSSPAAAPATPSPAAAAPSTAEAQETSATGPQAATAATATTPRRYDLSGIPAMDWPDEPAPRPGLTKRWVPMLVVTLLLLGGFFLLFLLPAILLIAGVLFLWISPLWSTSEKAIATVVPTLGLGAFLPLLAAGTGSTGSPALALLALVGFAAGVVALFWTARRGLAGVRRFDAEVKAQPKKKG